MDMSKAALPPRCGYISPEDSLHPLYHEYSYYRGAMKRLMVDSMDFRDWLRSKKVAETKDMAATHPRFKEWQKWFTNNKMGIHKKIPDGTPNTFPNNFWYWLKNGAY